MFYITDSEGRVVSKPRRISTLSRARDCNYIYNKYGKHHSYQGSEELVHSVSVYALTEFTSTMCCV